MANAPLNLARFNPQAEYVVVKPFVCGGRTLVQGEPFDRTLVTTRMFRLLYEQRKIAPPGGDVRSRWDGRKFNQVTTINRHPTAQLHQAGNVFTIYEPTVHAGEAAVLSIWQPPPDPDPYGEGVETLPGHGHDNANDQVVVAVVRWRIGTRDWAVVAGDEVLAGPFKTRAEAEAAIQAAAAGQKRPAGAPDA